MAHSKMEKQNVADIVAKELPELISTLSDLESKSSSFTENIKANINRLDDGGFISKDGITFLDVKNQLLLQYLIDLSFVMLAKLDGRSINNSDSVKRIVEIRTYLEKMRSIDQKLKYQIDKVVKLASEGAAAAANNPLTFKPNLDDMETDDENESEENDDEKSEIKKSQDNVYVVPKSVAVPYDDDSATNRRQKILDRARQRALDSSLIQELRSEYSEQPEEARGDLVDKRTVKRREKEDEVTKYEEDNFIRMPVSKKDKQSKRKSYERFDDITKFENIGILHQDVNKEIEDHEVKRKKKKFDNKKKFMGKKAKKSKFKRRK